MVVDNRYNNNPVFNVATNFPIEECGNLEITDGYELLTGINLIENCLFTSARTYLACIDIFTKKILWKKRLSHPIDAEDGRVYAYELSSVCYDIMTGEQIWKREGRDYPLTSSEKFIFCRDVLTDPSIVIY